MDAPDAEPTTDVGERVRKQLDESGRLVLKPIYGTTGSRIQVCSRTAKGYRINDKEMSATDFEAAIEEHDDYLVSAFVEQASYATDLYPDSTNTLRVLTMWDPKTDEPFITFTTQRIDTERSAPVDNWSKGGLTAAVDLESGELSRGVHFPSSGQLEWHDSHPETDAAITGVTVPNWSMVRDGIVEMAANYPQIPYVGWDIVITDDDEFTVIEANSCTDVDLFQVHEPLLDDPRARRFYEHYDIVPAE